MSKARTPEPIASKSALQLLQFGVAPDEGCEAAVEFGAEARRPLADRVGADRLFATPICL